MYKVLVSYDKRNKVAAQAMELMSVIKGVKINYDIKVTPPKNGLDEAIEDIKMGRVETYENFDEFKKSVYNELGCV
ncbi:MAG: hypothetical protein LBE79_06990 [Tannerella sp.]|nr:hypothetical protein [Tannerella sp.]